MVLISNTFQIPYMSTTGICEMAWVIISTIELIINSTEFHKMVQRKHSVFFHVFLEIQLYIIISFPPRSTSSSILSVYTTQTLYLIRCNFLLLVES
mmetsp:Transcript_28222/g.34365  ORF Transcript_28222/g.34365 Transcript_28222/m.34365 type:complete len:96 (-) Transcript_28222:141-428(-)